MTITKTKITKGQKKILNLLCCTYKNQILCYNLNATKTFMANPNFTSPGQSTNYDAMVKELFGYLGIITSSGSIQKHVYDASGFLDITVVDNNGNVVFSTSGVDVRDDDELLPYNSYDQYIDRINIPIRNIPIIYLSPEKAREKLNVDETDIHEYTVKPQYLRTESYNPNTPPSGSSINIGDRWFTQVTVTRRTGCPGVSNTGFISLSILVPIEIAPFNPCILKVCDNFSSSCSSESH